MQTFLKTFYRVAPLNPALTFLNSILYHFNDEDTVVVDSHNKVCMEHDHEELKPQLISTWMPNGIGAMPGKRVIFAETQVSTLRTTKKKTKQILLKSS